jgi:hypothetical protein
MAANTDATIFTVIWTNTGGPACPVAGNTSYNGNLKASVLGNNTTLTIPTNFTVNGDFQMTNSGSSTTLIIPAGVTLHVTGNMGDCTNNNVDFQVDGTLIVDGTLYGKNSNSFSGTGSVTAGGLDFGNSTSCPAPCNINWNVGTCEPSGSAFCTLPINLSYFAAEVRANGVHIRWVTESEEQVDYLTLQKSSNGKDFYGMRDYPSHSSGIQQRNYGFLDEHLLIGRSYYRIKETNLDGRIRFHRIISVDYQGDRMLDVYPVPVSGGVLNLRTNFPIVQEARLLIADVTGVVLQETALRANEALSVPVKLEPGIYLLTFISGDYRTVKRFVVN